MASGSLDGYHTPTTIDIIWNVRYDTSMVEAVVSGHGPVVGGVPTVACDIDGVLYELVPAVREFVHVNYGVPVDRMPDPKRYDLWSEWDLNLGVNLSTILVDAVEAGEMFWRGEAHQPGLNGLRTLKDMGFKVVLVSARDLPGLEDVCYTATVSWLASVDAVYDDLYITSDKTTVQFDFLIDDYAKNVRAAHAAGRHAILLNREWNTNVTDVRQAAWPEIPDIVASTFQAA